MTVVDGCSLRVKHRGLIGIKPKVPIRDTATLSWVYTPGVAKPCLEIEKHHITSFDYTMRGNTVAIVTDGSSVYGLGNVGPYAALPMLEAKSAFHKNFAGVDGFPIAINTQDVDEFVEIIRYLSPTFGGFHLEDISSPRCFAISERLKRAVSLPILHTDQQASATAVLAALINALNVVNKKLENVSVVINGAGAAGIATARMLKHCGAGNVKVLDRHGALYYRRPMGLNYIKSEVARLTNSEDKKGDLAEMIKGADVFIGFSAAGVLTPEMVQSMASDPIIFALALPEPEISFDAAKAAGAKVVATSLSHAPNQLNNSLVYPGIFRGALDVRATDINHEMLVGAAQAMASLVEANDLDRGIVLPAPLDYRVSAKIARAVAEAAMDSGAAQVPVDPAQIEAKVMNFVYEGSNAWVEGPSDTEVMQGKTLDEISLALHKRYHGVIETTLYVPIKDQHIYEQVYSQPEAARPCEVIRDNPEAAYDMTLKNNLVAIVTDGSAVLGLGNIGPGAGLPVMEGKAVLFKTFGGVEAFPICLRTQEIDEIVETVKAIAPVFGGINLEDIAAPRCFDVEARLTEELDIPVFHDDQHGTAVVVLAALLNAVKLTGKKLSGLKVTVNGAGAAALSVSKLLMKAGVQDIVICDTSGIIYKGREKGMNPYKRQIAEITNLGDYRGDLHDAIRGADLFLGLSAPGMVNQDMVRSMAKDPIIFALANPVPEIMPDEAVAAGARVVATGRSDFPNQVNNSLAFPGIFRGALDVRARRINDDMKIAAAYAISGLISGEQLESGVIIPGALDLRVPPAVASAVAQSAIDTGEARRKMDPAEISKTLGNYLAECMLSDNSHQVGPALNVTGAV
jgi:malate dehydrogenase (oxaloacetate-decarboxylating)